MLQSLRKHPYLSLFLFSAYLYLIGNQLIAVTDTAESNYALTAREMVLSGDWLSPRIYGRYWYDKPIFYYWELAASFAVFGFNEFAARFPSAVMGCVNVLFTFWFARKLYGETTAWLAALILGTSLEFWLLSKAVITDATLFFFMNAAVAAFYLGYTGNRRFYWLCYAFSGLAVLTKGPIGLALPGLSCLLFLLWKKDLKEMLHVHLFSGLLLFLGIGGSWYFYMYAQHGSDFLINFFGVHNFLRATVAEHERQNVWYFYIAMFFAGFAPWSFAAPAVLFRRWKKRGFSPVSLSDPTRFLLVWAFSVVAVFQLIATKYTTYTFPSLFAFAILSAHLFVSSPGRVWKTVIASAAVYTGLALLVAPMATLSHSGKLAGLAVAEEAAPGTPVLFFGDYRTSAVFYSGRNIFRLASIQDIEHMKPEGISWNAKNVMPFFPIEALSQDDPYLVIIPQKKKQELLSALPGKWHEKESAGDYILLENTR